MKTAGRAAPPGKGEPEAGASRAGLRQRLRNPLLVAGGLVLAAAARYPLLSHESADFFVYLRPWYDFIRLNGHFAALQHDFSNYSVPYLYLLTLCSLLAPSLVQLLAIKAVSIAFDFSLAWFVFLVVRLRFRESRTTPILAGLATLLFPTVVVNSAMWAQADTIYTTFLVASLYFVLRRRPAGAFLAWGLAFSLKAQAVFLLPLFYWLRQRQALSLRSSWLAPAAYLAALLPAWFLGRPFYDLLLVYFAQAGEVTDLVLEAPNLYQWIPADWYPFWPLGALLTVAAVLGIGALVRRSRAEITNGIVVSLAAFSVLLVPYLLPKMHDRYFFPADIFTLLLAFWRPRFFPAPIVVGGCSLAVYVVFLTYREIVPAPLLAAAMLLVLGALGRRLFFDLGFDGGAFGRERVREWFRRQWRRRRADLLPAGVLVVALAAVFVLFGGSGRFARPLAGDPVTALTLARAENRGAETAFVGFTRRTLDGSVAVAYELDDRGPFGGDLLLGAVVGRSGFDLSGGLRDARVLMALFFLGAALVAWLALRRLFENSWIALPATLLAFSPFAAGRFDLVAVEAAPAAFSVCLVFHGLVVFHRDGALRPLLLSLGVALSLSFQAYALLAGFLLFGLIPERWRQRLRPGGAPPSAGPGPPGLPDGRRNLALAGAFALLVGAGWVGLGAANRAALFAGEPRAAAAAPVLPVSTAAESAPGVRSAAEAIPSDSRRSSAEQPFRHLGRLFAPYAPFGGRDDGESSPAAVAAGLVLAVLALVGAALSKRRALLLPLALGGLVSALAAPPFAGGAVALPLALFALAAAHLARPGGERSRGDRPLQAVSLAALAVFLASGYRAAPVSPSGADEEAAAVEARLREDFGRIRRTLARRADERPAFAPVFAPTDPRSGLPDAAETAWYLAGNPVVEREDRRGLAQFVLTGERESGRGLLTPGNEEVFLYHRAAYDGEVDALLAAAGPPVIESDFEVRLHDDGLLLYVREGCPSEDREGTFILHLVPREREDLPPTRKAFDFDNLSFRFAAHAWEEEESRCVAGVRLPDYEFRRLITGRMFRKPLGGYIEDWRAEYTPPAPGATP